MLIYAVVVSATLPVVQCPGVQLLLQGALKLCFPSAREGDAVSIIGVAYLSSLIFLSMFVGELLLSRIPLGEHIKKGWLLLAPKERSNTKNYIACSPNYACLEKLLAFMKSLVRKAGLQMTASERQ